MSEQAPTNNPEQIEAVNQAVNALASEFHENWRQTRTAEDGTFEPRVKATTDAAWIEAKGTDQVDIANSTYNELPTDWQEENKLAAGVVVDVMLQHDGKIDLGDESTRTEVGATIHDAWLSRNEWAKGGELDVPFQQLSAEEQAKDVNQIAVAQKVFEV